MKASWKETAELIGVAAIVASLIFVGLQLKQSQAIALSAAYQARADSSLEFRNKVFDSPELLSALAKVLNGEYEDLTRDENAAYQFFFYSNLIYLENVHYQYVNGFVSDEQWQSNVLDIEDLLVYPGYRELWKAQPGRHRASFAQVMDDAITRMDRRTNDE